MAVITLVNSLARSAIIGSIATKAFDSLVISRFTQKDEKKKWIREKNLNILSQLSEEILYMRCDNLKEKRVNIKALVSKIVLLVEDQDLKTTLNNYAFILNEYECYKSDINIYNLNEELLATLNSYMRKM